MTGLKGGGSRFLPILTLLAVLGSVSIWVAVPYTGFYMGLLSGLWLGVLLNKWLVFLVNKQARRSLNVAGQTVS